MDFTKLRSYMETVCEQYGVPAWDLSVMQDHTEVFRMMDGYSDPERKRPVSRNDLYWIYSASKPITCAAAMRLVESGTISLDDDVAKYLPSYGHITVKTGNTVRPARRPMKIRHLFGMASGLEYSLDTPKLKAMRAESCRDTVAYMDALAEKPLLFDPGDGFNYSLSHDVLGAVIEVASGKTFGAYLKENVFDPLGMKDTAFRLSEDKLPRLSWLYSAASGSVVPSDDLPSERWPYESGGGGLCTSVDDYRLFADAMAHKGLGWNGYRLLKPDSVDLMRTNTLGYVQNVMFHKQLNQRNKDGYGYGLGVKTLVNPIASPGPLGEFGWDGAAGAYVSCDPENRLSVFYAQHILNFPIVYNEIMVRIRDLVYEALGMNG